MFLAKGIKAIFYDLDGTLRFNDPPGRELFADEAVRLGVPITPEDRRRGARWEHYYFASSEEIKVDVVDFPESKAFWANYSRRFLATLGATAEMVEAFALPLHEHMNKINRSNDSLMPHVQQTLKHLKETGLILAVVSNREEPYADYLKEIGLAEYFNFSLAAGEVQSWKPDKGIFEHALRLAGVQAEQTIYVGDNYYADVLGARNAGMNPILLDVHSLFEEPDCHVITSHLELLELLKDRDIQ